MTTECEVREQVCLLIRLHIDQALDLSKFVPLLSIIQWRPKLLKCFVCQRFLHSLPSKLPSTASRFGSNEALAIVHRINKPLWPQLVCIIDSSGLMISEYLGSFETGVIVK